MPPDDGLWLHLKHVEVWQNILKINCASRWFFFTWINLQSEIVGASTQITPVNTRNVSITKIVDSSSVQCAESKYGLRIKFLALVVCGLMRKIVTWEGIHVSAALCSQTVINDVCWVVTLAQCQLVRWLSVIACRAEIGRRVYRKKKLVRLLVSLFVCLFVCLFVLSLLFL